MFKFIQFLCVPWFMFAFLSEARGSETSLTYYVIEEQARPFQISSGEGGYSGIASDLVEAIFAQSDISLNYETLPFRRMLRKMEQTRDSHWIALGSPEWQGIQAERLSKFPIFTAHHVAVVAKNVNPSQTNISHLSELKSKHAILLFGFDYPGLAPFLKKQEMTRQFVKTYDSAFKLIQRHPQESVFIEMELRVEHNLKRFSFPEDQIYSLDMSSVIPDYDIHLAYSPGLENGLVEMLDAEILKLKGNGQLEAIIARYR
ncbi:substrate-binding periplasmic protein [Litoribrevibacter albus]|uniref:substrate-binding periplasmic protein n=1 Tax=Litoribrevibacter albus TaxID=1473156 RepID=UPI0024E0F0D4|nr:hypothetical protein [Litoribrevibacter albus]